jgi:hypothetical protein
MAHAGATVTASAAARAGFAGIKSGTLQWRSKSAWGRDQRQSRAMHKMTAYLAAGVALLALAGAVPAPAAEKRHHSHHARHYVRHHGGGNIHFGDPDRYFGVGPGSYECFGYDCNW